MTGDRVCGSPVQTMSVPPPPTSFFAQTDVSARSDGPVLCGRKNTIWKFCVETPRAVNNGGTFIWTLESVTSGRSRMRLPGHEGFPERGDTELRWRLA